MDDKEIGAVIKLKPMTEEEVKEAAEAWSRINATTERFINVIAQIQPIVLNSTGFKPGTIIMRKD